MKLKYLRHPIRTARAAGYSAAARLEMREVAKEGERRFRADKRYNLSAVIEGFSCHIDNTHQDTALLERICTAYRRSVEQQKSAPDIYAATGWWQEVRQSSLRPVMDALLDRDLATLRAMYRNFYRDPCSTGLISVPYGMTSAYFGKTITNVHRHYYLSDVLHRVDYWKAQTSGRFALQELAGAPIGNPFGVVIDDTLVEAGAPFRHYCAQRIRQMLSPDDVTVVEIGGGFGGAAYYLLRDRPGTTYIDLDAPESVALTSYYLMRSFPDLNFLLYGEEELTQAAIEQADVVLLPLFELTGMPARIAEVSLSSHSMSDLSRDALTEYLNHIARMTKRYFLYMGANRLLNAPGVLLETNPLIHADSVLFTGLLPDGYHIAAMKDGGIWVSNGAKDEFSAAVGDDKIWIEESDQTSTIVSAAMDGSARTTEINDAEVPVASIDGKYVAYLRSIKGRCRIWLRSANQEGLPDVPLTPPGLNVSEMSFGANDSLIFAAAEDRRPPGLFSVDLDGKVRPLLLGEARYPAVSPDAHWLAYSRLSHGYWNLWLTDLESGGLRRMTNEPCNDISPAWSTDRHELIFASDCGRALWFTALRRQSVR